jgi:hypothetical protein
MNIIDAISKYPHKEIKIDKCVTCGKDVYQGYVICKSCIADTLIFNEEYAGTILGTDFFDNFDIDDWKEVIDERLNYFVNKDRGEG